MWNTSKCYLNKYYAFALIYRFPALIVLIFTGLITDVNHSGKNYSTASDQVLFEVFYFFVKL